MKKINAISLFVFFVLFSLYGCEYDKDEVYYVEVEKPVNREITFNLMNLPDGEMIYIYQGMRFKYDLSLPEGNVIKQRFYLGGEELTSYDDYITLSPEVYSSKTTKKLRLEVEVESTSESIAKVLGLENSIGTFEYEIVFIPGVKLKLQNITHHKNKDNYVELTWNKPELKQYTVEGYRVTCYHDRTGYTEVIHPDQPVFIDTRAVHGYLHYKIETLFKESYREPWVDNYTTVIEFPKKSVKFEYTGINSGKISWPKSEYRAKYAFAIGYYGSIVYEGTNNYFEIDDLADFSVNNGIGVFPISNSGEWVELYVLPMDATDINRNMPIHYDELHGQSLITRDRNINNYIIFADTSRDLLFIKNNDEIWCYNSKTLDVINNQYVSGTIPTDWNIRAFCSEKSSKIFIANHDWIDLISYDLKNHEKVQFDSNEKLKYSYAYLGTNDVVFVGPEVSITQGEERNLYAYDLNSRNLLSSFTLENKWDEIIVSRDGKYVCTYNRTRALVYRFSDNLFSLICTENFPAYGLGDYEAKNICFNEKISNQLIITLAPGMYNNEMYTLNVENGVKSDKKRYSYRCSDPYEGNIVVLHGNNCAIFDTTLSNQPLFLANVNTDYLIDGWFLKSGWGNQKNLYYLNIANSLKK